MSLSFRLFDFNVITDRDKVSHLEAVDEVDDADEDSGGSGGSSGGDSDVFVVQAFGMNELGRTLSLWMTGFRPFFYVKVGDGWSRGDAGGFIRFVGGKMGKRYKGSLVLGECDLVNRKKLYGFDGGKRHNFVKLVFTSLAAYNRVRNLWYQRYEEGKPRKLLPGGLKYGSVSTWLYESNIPPLLKLFHIKGMSPSGWVELPVEDAVEVDEDMTTCDANYEIDYSKVVPQGDKEDPVPYKICSFDIEASSSHGDFPLAVKNYRKLATDVLDVVARETTVTDALVGYLVMAAFGRESYDHDVPLVYPKEPVDIDSIREKLDCMLAATFNPHLEARASTRALDSCMACLRPDDEGDGQSWPTHKTALPTLETTISKFLGNPDVDRESKLAQLTKMLDGQMPPLKGDEVTFIGSTFMEYGKSEPYLQHCIVVGTSDAIAGVEIESYGTEKEAIVAWTRLMQKEDPDIVIGYNIFGFDYKFLHQRACQLNCTEDFLMLSKNRGEVCGEMANGAYRIKKGEIVLASGPYELNYVETPGRIQVDMHNYFRRDYNLQSYKLDFVASSFIGDKVKKLDLCQDELTGKDVMKVGSKNMTGLSEGDYVTFEEIGHSSNMYMDGKKFKVDRMEASGRLVHDWRPGVPGLSSRHDHAGPVGYGQG